MSCNNISTNNLAVSNEIHQPSIKLIADSTTVSDIIIGNNISLENGTVNSLNIGGVIFAKNINSNKSGTPLKTSVDNALVGIGTPNPKYTLEVNGSFGATSKSFLIKHPDPNKVGKYLEHGVTESPEHTVFVRGKLIDNNIIQLPDYWPYLVDTDTITITLTPRGIYQKLYVVDIVDNQIIVGNEDNTTIDCYYYIVGERKDIPKLITEI